MPFANKENEADARERLRAFWAGSSLGRPALNVFAKRDADELPALPEDEDERKAKELDPRWHALAHSEAYEGREYLAEAMPGHHVVWGALLTTLPVLAGGDYGFRTGTAWIKPRPGVYELPAPVFDPDHPVNRTLEACYDATVAAVGERGFVSPPLMMDGLTTLAEFRTQEQMCMDLLERPDDVMRWAGAMNRMYIEIYEHHYQRLGAGDSLCFFGALAEGRSEGVQCDFSVMLSPAMYAEFVLPDLRQVTDYMDFSLYHLDGVGQMRFLDCLQQCPKLNGIQWNPETHYGEPLVYLDELREIRRRGFCLDLRCDNVAQAVGITRGLGPDGLFLHLPTFATRDEAEAAIAAIAAAS